LGCRRHALLLLLLLLLLVMLLLQGRMRPCAVWQPLLLLLLLLDVLPLLLLLLLLWLLWQWWRPLILVLLLLLGVMLVPVSLQGPCCLLLLLCLPLLQGGHAGVLQTHALLLWPLPLLLPADAAPTLLYML
jgi:hypothetical protein